ncbi:tRNA pseudouridine(55) synthase TruB [Rhodohalobacter mucosus]|uniref:tRNA pseudouridine synthase B n=1 Tax=Rhodohalobacter mucosus TaxID=2079485 RepID=A0A316TPP3_9BACT|nr:tRNA pseudouridine(55) synthase TruB [Rhodohalobacter mucosus]PWN06577.1 tRNA pseudouridine(55) synthase TruB [Rhodohalobacter mucosus]
MARKVIPLSELPVIDTRSSVSVDSAVFSEGAAVLMDKPLDWSSFQLVKYVRNRIPPKKVGHAGTLDPLATGLLILCTGRATKTISQFQDLQKTYRATIRFGYSTPSFDMATEPDEHAEWKHINESKISEALQNEFTGVISQVPPVYSAIKVKGQRLYKLARKGVDVQPEPRNVEIHSIDILNIDLPDIELQIQCGKGTYIRSLAHDLGLFLGSRAVLTALRRTRTGSFSADHAFLPEEFDTFMHNLKN